MLPSLCQSQLTAIAMLPDLMLTYDANQICPNMLISDVITETPEIRAEMKRSQLPVSLPLMTLGYLQSSWKFPAQ